MTEPLNGATPPPPRCPDCRKTGGAVRGVVSGIPGAPTVIALLTCAHCGTILGAQLLPAPKTERPLIEVPR